MKQACRALLALPPNPGHILCKNPRTKQHPPPSPKRVRECDPPSNPENRLEGWEVVGQIPAAGGTATARQDVATRRRTPTFSSPIPVLIRLFIPGTASRMWVVFEWPPTDGGNGQRTHRFPVRDASLASGLRRGGFGGGMVVVVVGFNDFGLPDQGEGALRGGNALTRWRWRRG